MKVLVDICHPAHVHFFKNAIREWRAEGHAVHVTSRLKDVAVPLLDALGIAHEPLSGARAGAGGLARELISRDAAMVRTVRREKPDVLVALGGTFAAHAGFATRTPSVVFYDTECARLQNLITYPLATRVVVPRCYAAWLPPWSERYAGYHELAYLRPNRFTPDRARALANGLAPGGDTFLIRCVSWQANHDIGERGWSAATLREVAAFLAARGRVLISSEAELPPDLQPHRYPGAPDALHDVLAHCRLLVGESATLASEAAVLGVPAIYAAHTGRGYTDEQEARYGLVANIRAITPAAIVAAMERLLAESRDAIAARRQRLLDDTVDVVDVIKDVAARCARPGRAG